MARNITIHDGYTDKLNLKKKFLKSYIIEKSTKIFDDDEFQI